MKNTSSIVTSTKQFADDYNSAVDFLTNNQSMSTSVLQLSISFSSTKFNSCAYGSIGIKVDTSGRLSVDETKLTTALGSDAGRVKELLGDSHGLATRTISQATLAVNSTTNLVHLPKFIQKAHGTISQSMLFNIFA